MSAAPAAGRLRDAPDPAGQLVKVALLMRLAALVVATAGLVGSELTAQVLVALMLMGGASFLGLSQPRVIAAVARHPMLAMADLVVVLAVFAVLGVDSPLGIGALSTALLIGLLFRAWVCALLAGTLLVGYVGAAAQTLERGGQLGFMLAVGVPATLMCMAGIGQAFRRIQQSQQAAERELAALLQANATHSERARLAREVHDSLAKSLQGLAFGAAALPTWVERDGQRARSEARVLADGASQAVQEARTLLGRMRIDEPARPFADVLAEVVQAWSEQHEHAGGRGVRRDIAPVPELGADARYELLAAAREALENVQRHAPGAAVRVSLQPCDGGRRRGNGHGWVRLEVVDDGPGFDPAGLGDRERQGHFGVRGIRERLLAVGGRAVVRSALGRGTTVQLEVPVVDPHLLAARSQSARDLPARDVPRDRGGATGATGVGARRR